MVAERLGVPRLNTCVERRNKQKRIDEDGKTHRPATRLGMIEVAFGYLGQRKRGNVLTQFRRGLFDGVLTLRQAKLRKGGQDVASLKPFIATLWVANPTRQGLASHRKRVLRGGQQWPLRSGDSQHQGRVIEPREHYPRRAFGFVSPRATSARRHGKACPVPPGSKSRP